MQRGLSWGWGLEPELWDISVLQIILMSVIFQLGSVTHWPRPIRAGPWCWLGHKLWQDSDLRSGDIGHIGSHVSRDWWSPVTSDVCIAGEALYCAVLYPCTALYRVCMWHSPWFVTGGGRLVMAPGITHQPSTSQHPAQWGEKLLVLHQCDA